MTNYDYSPCFKKRYKPNKDGKPSKWYWNHIKNCQEPECTEVRESWSVDPKDYQITWWRRLLNKIKGGLK